MSLDKSQALNAAKQYVLQRKVQAAVDIYRKIIEDDPSDLTAINTLGDLYVSTGQVQDAIAHFSRAADTYIEHGSARKAIATLKKVLEVDPSNTETATKLADLYAQAGLPSEARQHYLQIADALTRKGATLDALRVFTKIVQLDPANTSTRIKLGELYLREGMNEQAYEAFVTAAEQLARKGENRRALNAYNEALAIRPDSDAQAAARKLMSLLGVDPDKDPRHPESQRVVPGVAHENSAGPAASDSSSSSTPLDLAGPNSDSFVVQELSKAEILVAYGKVNEAVSMLRRVLERKPDSIDVHIKLKDIFLRTGMMVEAARECIALERIYEARGESDRARDYAVRASRLTPLLDQHSGDLPEPRRKPVEVDPRLSSAPIEPAPPQHTAPKPRPVAGRADVRPVQPGPMASPVVPSNPAAVEPTSTSAAGIRQGSPSKPVESAPPAAETKVAIPSKPAAVEPTTSAAGIRQGSPSKPVESSAPPAETKVAIPSTPAAIEPPSTSAAGIRQGPPSKPVESARPPAETKVAAPSTPAAVEPPSSSVAGIRQGAPSKPVEVAPPPAETKVAVPSTAAAVEMPSAAGTRHLSLSKPVESFLPAADTKLVISPAHESALVQVAQVSTDAREPGLPVLFASSLPVVKRRGRLTVAGIAAGVFVLLGVGAVIGGFAYDAHLDKEYAALSLAAPPLAAPSPPQATEGEAEPVQQNEEITVVATPSPQADAYDQKQKPELRAIKSDQPAPRQPANEPPRMVSQPSPMPPRAIASPDVRGGTEARTPDGVPVTVPVGATQPAEPPPRAVQKSPGVVHGGAIKRVDPVYPATAKVARLTGAVAVEVTISEQGNVTSARALSGPFLLRNAAVSAARGWKFKASTLGGVPVTTTTTIVFNFKL